MMKAKIAATAGLMLLLLALGAEADVCKSRSKTYDGWCVHNTNCIAVCMSEGNEGGFCEGVVVRECMCTHDCEQGKGGGGGGGGGGGDDSSEAKIAAGGRRAGGHE